VPVAAPGRRAAALVFVAVLAVLASCSSGSPASPTVRAAAVYDTIVRWFAQSKTDDPVPLPVFIEPRGEGATIKLDVQAELVKSTKDVATVRFIDTRDEALVTNDDGTVVVADGGILLRLAPVIEVGNKVQLDVDVHVLDEQFRTLQFDLKLVADKWVVEQPPVEIPSG
jgi:hypothetical protein